MDSITIQAPFLCWNVTLCYLDRCLLENILELLAFIHENLRQKAMGAGKKINTAANVFLSVWGREKHPKLYGKRH